jgi:hypothetical protein
MQQRAAFTRGAQQTARVVQPSSLHMQARKVRCPATPNPAGTTTTTAPGHEELETAVKDLLAAAKVGGLFHQPEFLHTC